MDDLDKRIIEAAVRCVDEFREETFADLERAVRSRQCQTKESAPNSGDPLHESTHTRRATIEVEIVDETDNMVHVGTRGERAQFQSIGWARKEHVVHRDVNPQNVSLQDGGEDPTWTDEKRIIALTAGDITPFQRQMVAILCRRIRAETIEACIAICRERQDHYKRGANSAYVSMAHASGECAEALRTWAADRLAKATPR